MLDGYSAQPVISSGHSPVGGLSDALFAELARQCQADEWTRSPIGGLSLPEFQRIFAAVNQGR